MNTEKYDEVKEGSSVIFNRGIPHQGRVIAISYGKYAVNRDGYVGTINAKKNELENLSIGPVAELERQIWVLENRKSRISGHMEDAEIPNVLLKNKHNFIHVLEVKPKYPMPVGNYQSVTFISSIDKLSHKLKIQSGLLCENEYYQIEMENIDIKSVLKSTKEVFDNC